MNDILSYYKLVFMIRSSIVYISWKALHKAITLKECWSIEIDLRSIESNIKYLN